MSNFEIHELTEKAINRNSNIIHDTLYGEDYETGKNLAGAVADLNNIQIANEYDDTSTYDYGDYCIYEGVLYRNIVAIAVAEAWTVAHWTAVMVTGEYKRVRIMTKAQFDLLSNDEKDGFIYVSDYPTKIQDIDNVTLTTSDNDKLLGVSVSGSDISVGAVSEGTGIDITSNTVSLDINGLTSASTLDGTEEIAIYDGTGNKSTTAAAVAGLANVVEVLTVTDIHSSATINAYKSGKVVNIICTDLSIAGGSWVILGKVAVAPPKQQVSLIALNGSLNVFGQLIVDTGGTIQMYHSDSAAQGFFNMNISYITD